MNNKKKKRSKRGRRRRKSWNCKCYNCEKDGFYIGKMHEIYDCHEIHRGESVNDYKIKFYLCDSCYKPFYRTVEYYRTHIDPEETCINSYGLLSWELYCKDHI